MINIIYTNIILLNEIQEKELNEMKEKEDINKKIEKLSIKEKVVKEKVVKEKVVKEPISTKIENTILDPIEWRKKELEKMDTTPYFAGPNPLLRSASPTLEEKRQWMRKNNIKFTE